VQAAFQHPGGLHTVKQINFTRSRILERAYPWAQAYAKLLSEADIALGRTPSAPLDFRVIGPQNPAQREPLDGDASAAYVTALGYALNANLSNSKREQYGEKAISLLNNWGYVNKSIGGEDGPLDAAQSGNLLIHTAELMWNSPLWKSHNRAQFKKWADTVLYPACQYVSSGQFILWPSISSRDPRLWPANVNLGGWGMVCSLAVNQLTDNSSRMADDIAKLKTIIDIQIERDGTMPGELARRESSRYYTYFALKAMTAAVEIARNTGTDLYYYAPPTGGTLKQALDWYWQNGIVNPSSWPIVNQNFQEKLGTTKRAGGIFLEPMGHVYNESTWKKWTAKTVVYQGGGNTSWVMPTLMKPFPTGE
jgi:hypothetical protein